MFTGIVLGQGQILAAQASGSETRLTVKALFDLPHLVVGESIAVNGACITVETGKDNIFSGYVSAESLRVTTLGSLKSGATVNLERALALGDRLGGHIVSGHVDTVAHVLEVENTGDSRRIRVGFPSEFAPEVIRKGSITLDGISLTINDCTDDSLCVNVIPETWRVTTVGQWRPGSLINFETDVLGKYVRRNMAFLATPAPPSQPAQSRIDMDFLRDNGFV